MSMNKTAAAFVAGAVLTAAALLYSNLHGPTAAFFAGVAVVLVAQLGGLQIHFERRASKPVRNSRTAKAAAPVAPVAPVSPVESDVALALVTLKVRKDTAAAAAARAVALKPTGNFDELFRIALPFAKA
jgi:hypothetical protein